MKLPPLLALAILASGTASRASAQGLLYVADSGGTDRVWSFDATTGDLVSDNIFSDAALTTLLQATPLANGNFLAVDQGAGSTGGGVFEYAPDGTRLRTLVASDGTTSQFRPGAVYNGRFYFGVAGGTNAGNILSVALAGNAAPSVFATAPSGDTRTSSVWGIAVGPDGLYATNSVSTSASSGNARVQRFGFDGAFLGDLVVNTTTSAPPTGLLFPQQIEFDRDGGLLVAGFSGTSGVYGYTAAGSQTSFMSTGGGNRGVFRLGNGGLLTTQGTQVIRVNPDGTTTSVVNRVGSSFRAITAAPAPVPEPASLAALGLGALALLRRRRS